jgi:acyl carrier protein
MLKKKKSEHELIKLILEICPKLSKNLLISKEVNLVNDGYLDSLDILQIISAIEKIKRKKINPAKINRTTFKNLKTIMKLLNK